MNSSLLTLTRNRAPLQMARPGHAVLSMEPKAASKEVMYAPGDIDVPMRFDPVVVMHFGRRGKGKTSGMTALAHYMRQWNEFEGVACRDDCPSHCTDHVRIASNYWMEAAHIVNPKLVEDLTQYPPWGVRLLICLDEIGALVNNRRGQSGSSVNFIAFATQIRKRECEMAFTTQMPQTVDLQILFQIDLFRRMHIFRGYNPEGRWGTHIRVVEHDYWGQWSGDFRRRAWPPQEDDADGTWVIWDIDVIFGDYRDKEVVAPIWAKNKDQIIMREHGEDWDSEYDLGYEFTPEVAEYMAAEPPKNLDEFLYRQGGTFQVVALLNMAKRLAPEEVKAMPTFKKALLSRGYNVWQADDGAWMADRP